MFTINNVPEHCSILIGQKCWLFQVGTHIISDAVLNRDPESVNCVCVFKKNAAVAVSIVGFVILIAIIGCFLFCRTSAGYRKAGTK